MIQPGSFRIAILALIPTPRSKIQIQDPPPQVQHPGPVQTQLAPVALLPLTLYLRLFRSRLLLLLHLRDLHINHCSMEKHQDNNWVHTRSLSELWESGRGVKGGEVLP